MRSIVVDLVGASDKANVYGKSMPCRKEFHLWCLYNIHGIDKASEPNINRVDNYRCKRAMNQNQLWPA